MDRTKSLLAQITTLNDESLPELPLGIVRDSALNSSNDFDVMFETFEMALDRVGKALRITVPFTASGVSRAAV